MAPAVGSFLPRPDAYRERGVDGPAYAVAMMLTGGSFRGSPDPNRLGQGL